MEEVDIVIIGAGVVGLAIAERLSDIFNNIIVIEKHEAFGQECSGRSSEVIHASVYYSQDSLKGKLCLRGNDMMYEICKKNKIPYSNCGKLIVATNDEEEKALPGIFKTAQDNHAKHVQILDQNEIKKIEKKVEAVAAVYCPSSGIVDSHQLMRYFEAKASENGVMFAYNHEVKHIDFNHGQYEINVEDSLHDSFTISSKIVINAAGLYADKIAQVAGIDIEKEKYKIYYHKGIYCRALHRLNHFPKTLIYPIPPEKGSVGIHTVPDLYGGMRLGPHFIWSDTINYTVGEEYRSLIYDEARKYLPFLEYNDVQIDMAGIMATVQVPGEDVWKDFIITNEYEKGLPGFVNLIGIESPGLTAAPAIAEYIENHIEL